MDLDVVPAVAVSFTVCAVETAATFAGKAAYAEKPGMVIEAGTFTSALLLASETVTPPFGAEPERVTLQESARDPTMEEVLQLSALNVGAWAVPVPVRLTV